MRMEFFLTAVFVVSNAVGCTSSENSGQVKSEYSDFGLAVETIATSPDWDSANAAAAAIYEGGLPAIEELRHHLSDDRVIPSGYSIRAVLGKVTMGEQAFWAIQDLIETPPPKSFDHYSVLDRNNVEEWLDQRRGKSLSELRIEAAATSLRHAKLDHDETGNPDALKAIDFYKELLKELERRAPGDG